MAKQRTLPDPGADIIDPSDAAGVQTDGAVNRSLILRAALGIIDRDGIESLSHASPERRSRPGSTVIYRHVPSEAAVLNGVAEIVLGQLRVDTAHTDWISQLRHRRSELRRLALAHPNTVALLVTRPLATPFGQRPPGMLRPLEDVLALLTAAGFSGPDALHIHRVLFGYLHGHILTELQEVIERRGDRRCAAPGPAPAVGHRVPSGARAGIGAGVLRRRR